MIFGGQFAGPRDRARLRTQLGQIRAWALAHEWFTLREASEGLEQLYAPTLFPESSLSAETLRRREPVGCAVKKKNAGELARASPRPVQAELF